MPARNELAIACSNRHRLRDHSDLDCGRYAGLMGGARTQALNRARLWQLVKDAGMSITLHRCVCDLGAGTLAVERRTDAGWTARESFSLR